ncbi:unnamed protein product [Amoebophrya sp. A120]|nr:unnamed protein product [Amoebophrya sp. A120]|eukprot:GSA120T00008471001.1
MQKLHLYQPLCCCLCLSNEGGRELCTVISSNNKTQSSSSSAEKLHHVPKNEISSVTSSQVPKNEISSVTSSQEMRTTPKKNNNNRGQVSQITDTSLTDPATSSREFKSRPTSAGEHDLNSEITPSIVQPFTMAQYAVQQALPPEFGAEGAQQQGSKSKLSKTPSLGHSSNSKRPSSNGSILQDESAVQSQALSNYNNGGGVPAGEHSQSITAHNKQSSRSSSNKKPPSTERKNSSSAGGGGTASTSAQAERRNSNYLMNKKTPTTKAFQWTCFDDMEMVKAIFSGNPTSPLSHMLNIRRLDVLSNDLRKLVHSCLVWDPVFRPASSSFQLPEIQAQYVMEIAAKLSESRKAIDGQPGNAGLLSSGFNSASATPNLLPQRRQGLQGRGRAVAAPPKATDRCDVAMNPKKRSPENRGANTGGQSEQA